MASEAMHINRLPVIELEEPSMLFMMVINPVH